MTDPIDPLPRVPTAQRGAISELIACAYFIELGWDVFRCQSPACPFDLVIHKNGILKRVEVKSANSGRSVGQSPSFSPPKNDQWDVLCVVLDGRSIALEKGMTPHELRNAVRVWAGYPPMADHPEGGFRLTNDDIRAIRMDTRMHKDIARAFGTSVGYVSMVKSGQSRRNSR